MRHALCLQQEVALAPRQRNDVLIHFPPTFLLEMLENTSFGFYVT
jgi:hypothetical protein